MNMIEQETTYCFSPESIGSPGMWGVNILDFMLPVFLGQTLLIILVTQAVSFLLKPLRQPKVIAETIAGILLGPSFLGNYFHKVYKLMPGQNFVLLDSAAYFALTYYMFMVAVELDVRTIRGMGKKVLIIAVVGMASAFVASFISANAFNLNPNIIIQFFGLTGPTSDESENSNRVLFLLLLSLSVSITGLPVLTRIITELKLLNTPLGPISIASAIINDMFAWILLGVTLACTGGKYGKRFSLLVPLWITLSGAVFVFVCFYVVRPVISWLVGRTPEGERTSNFHLGIILIGVPAAGFLSDLIGVHSLFGSFVYGLAVPAGPLTTDLVQRMDLFLEYMMLPLFFANSGYRTSIQSILPLWAIAALAGVVVISTVAKVVSTIIVAMLYSMSFRDSLSLGFLMSVRGPIEMIILNIAIDKKALRGDMLAVIIVTSVLLMGLVVPVVTLALIKPSKPLVAYRRRNIQGARPDMELRVLACIHNTRNVLSLTRLLDVSNPSKRSPIFVYALHLVEVAGRVSSMLIMHPSAGYSNQGNRPTLPYGQAQSESILAAIDGYEQHSAGVSFQPVTAFSQPATMHEDICSIAAERHVSLIVLPFHKYMTIDGTLEEVGGTAVRPINLNVLADAPCSVAVLVDHNQLGTGVFLSANHASNRVALIFIGGADDREALAYAWRMAEHPAICLSVIRFIEPAAPSRSMSISSVTDMNYSSPLLVDAELDKEQDEEAVKEFRLRFVSDESVVFTEKVACDGGDTAAALREMGNTYDLYLVGRSNGRKSVLTAGLEEWSEFPELGPIGDLLASSDFGAKVSVLVLQQYVDKKLIETQLKEMGHNGPRS